MKLEQVERSYDHASKKYDERLKLWFGQVLRIERHRAAAVARLGNLRGAKMLDIGCGTGANLPLLLPQVGESGHVLGIDWSEGMLGRARARVARAGWPNVELRRGDAVKLDGVDGPFDAVISCYCLGIVYDLKAALSRAVDLLRPGGRLAVLDFDHTKPSGPLRALFPLYRALFVRYGIDTVEDMDDAALNARWSAGKAVLRERLGEVSERRFLFNLGFVLSARKPG